MAAGIVPDPSAINDVDTRLLRQGHEHGPVGIVDRRLVELVSGLPEFVAGRHDADARTPANTHMRAALAGEQGHVPGVQSLAWRKEGLAFADVLAAAPDVVAGPYHAVEDEVVPVAPPVLLHEHGVAPMRARARP